MRRVVDKLLHAPTVRVKELAGPRAATPTRTRCGSCSIWTRPGCRGHPGRRRRAAGTRPGRQPDGGRHVSRPPLRLGTRKSPMAMAQSRPGGPAHHRAHRGQRGTGRGDHVRRRDPGRAGPDRRHRRLRQCAAGNLLAGQVDLAVHSLKDLPVAPPPGLVLAAVPARDDPRDALAARDGAKFADLPPGATVGTGSPRRAAQLRLLRPDIRPVPVRGNAGHPAGQGRIGRAGRGAAGQRRAGPDRPAGRRDPDLRAGRDAAPPGQGALAVECRAGDTDLAGLLAQVDDRPAGPRSPRNGPCWPDWRRVQRAGRRVCCRNGDTAAESGGRGA